jgi:hypothetical protein
MKKAVWNTLPAKPEDVARVRALIGHVPMHQNDIVNQSGLSKTRCLCALDALLARKAIEEVGKGEFRRLGEQGG